MENNMDDKEFVETQLKAFCEAYQVPEKDKPKVRDFLEKLRNFSNQDQKNQEAGIVDKQFQKEFDLTTNDFNILTSTFQPLRKVEKDGKVELIPVEKKPFHLIPIESEDGKWLTGSVVFDGKIIETTTLPNTD